MTRIPTHTRQVTPSGAVSGAVIPQSIASTGQGIEAQGLAALGQGIGSLTDAIQQIELANGASEAATAATQAESQMREFKAGLAFNNDPKTYQEGFDKTIESIKTLKPESGVGAKRFNDIIGRNIDRWESDVKILGLQKSKSNIEADHITNRASAIQSTNLDMANLMTEMARDVTGVLTEEEAAKELLQNEIAVEKVLKGRSIGIAQGIAFKAWQATVTPENPDGDLDAGFDIIEASDIPEEDKQEAESEYKTRVSNRRAEGKLKLEEATKSSVNDINKKLNNDELSDIQTFINSLPMDETEKNKQIKLANSYIASVKSYKDNVITSDQTRIQALALISNVKTGDMSFTSALEFYNLIAKSSPINTTDGKGFINGLFAASEEAGDGETRQRTAMLKGREKLLRDSIEKQPNLFGAEESEEILKDFANKAVIELNDKFRTGKYDKKQVDSEVNRLMRKYSMSEEQQLRVASARQLRLAESLEDQQTALKKNVGALLKQGRRAEAKALLDEAVSLGIFEVSGSGSVKNTKGKKKVDIKEGFFNRLKEQFK
jgi:hypothetical protein